MRIKVCVKFTRWVLEEEVLEKCLRLSRKERTLKLGPPCVRLRSLRAILALLIPTAR